LSGNLGGYQHLPGRMHAGLAATYWGQTVFGLLRRAESREARGCIAAQMDFPP